MQQKDLVKNGESFGELALKDEPARHEETVIALQKTGLIAVPRDRFVKVYNRIKSKQANMRILIIQEVEIL